MTVAELIEVLQAVEDKTIPVCIEDWNEQYAPPTVAGSAWCHTGVEYTQPGEGRLVGNIVCIEAD